MNTIAFIDTEIDPTNLKVLDIGSIKDDGSTFHSSSVAAFARFLNGIQFICGHNILNHDLQYIKTAFMDSFMAQGYIIDTLYLSPLLFPAKPYHALLKDDKLQTEDINNPLNDALKAKDLFYSEIAAFKVADETIKQIFYLLLKDKMEFRSFFHFIGYACTATDPAPLILQKFKDEICNHAGLSGMITDYPIALAYCLSLIHANSRYAIIPPWILKNYPDVESIMFRLRNQPCMSGCGFCNKALNIYHGLSRFFGFDSFRTYGGEPLQEKAVKAAIDNKSILVVFPTGGGKSITFQVPALMSGENVKGLTLVISPLQSLMKDQVDNLENNEITAAVTINGLLDPVERGKSFERVKDGSASILYISPESLRSYTIEQLLLGRKIVRVVVDEAHCFSSWGQDFRVDYLYIGDFIKSIQEKKNLRDKIPVSCFTATAKPKVIEDIQRYFEEKLGINLELITSKVSRTNLRYKVLEKGNQEEKYRAVRNLIEAKSCPTIIYVSRTKKAYRLAKRLTEDGLRAKPYHGKMDVKEKTASQEAFIRGEAPIIVATSAFGMGVDKKDVGMVIHYEISDSIENYMQEAGRAGRDENIVADCFVLFNEEDLDKHFLLLNQTKLSVKEIQQVWKAIKEITRFRSTVSNSALEIARQAGWDDNVAEIETRVKTAIAALEDAGYVKRGQNIPRIYASSILSKNALEAIDKINASEKFAGKQKEHAIRIIKKLISSKSRKHSHEEAAESRIDYISDHLGIRKEEVINIVNLLREEKILAYTKDLTAFIKKGESKNRSLHIVEAFAKVENFLLPFLEEQEKSLAIKELNETAGEMGIDAVNPVRIKTLINFWAIKKWIKRRSQAYSRNALIVESRFPELVLQEKFKNRHNLAIFIVDYLYQKINLNPGDDTGQEEGLVEFSVHELKEAYENSLVSFGTKVSVEDVEDTLFYLSRIESIKIEGGFLVVYNRLTIERIEQDNLKRYTKDDYQKLDRFYENKVQQIHIVGEYARKMLRDYKDALQFVEDYFQLHYSSFVKKYFPGTKADDLSLKMTSHTFRQLFGTLSPTQLKIIKDKEAKLIVVAAGPGSGKTRVLVHKLASLLLMEDVKHEQLLMVTFSRAAATEFKKRLLKLIGNAASYVEIKTFHSYCFDLLGKVGSLEKSDTVLKNAVAKIRKKEVEASRITKTVLVIDEAQDMDEDEFDLIITLIKQNEEMRVIAVGDDDQNIYGFRGASSEYLKRFIASGRAVKYELVENYRSKANLVAFTNQFVEGIRDRLKQQPVIAKQTGNGSIRVIRYQSKHLISPVVKDILAADLTGTTCILTTTNDEALQVTGLLRKNGIQAKLIQTNEGFSLYNLLEIRYFLNRIQGEDFIIPDEAWEKAKLQLINQYRRSSKREVCVNMIKDFEATYPKRKYRSDLEVFIRESKLEDFFGDKGDTVFVSTIHKAKGKEFDNVFVMLVDFNPVTDEAKRQLYVAMTRAKQNLAIHLNSYFLDNFTVEGMERTEDVEKHLPPNEITMHLTHKDVWLDYFIRRQHVIAPLVSGDRLLVKGDGCLNLSGQYVVKFSTHLAEKIEAMKHKNYELTEARVNFIVYWRKEEMEKEIKVIMPELYLKRK